MHQALKLAVYLLLLCVLPRAANTGEAVRRARANNEASLEALGRYTYIYIYIYMYYVCVYIYIYIYIDRERERERFVFRGEGDAPGT